ncbi:Metacaspase-1 [Durusdinium trenchii]|uniref:Metacaspase-1 n=1 Tax=Durusdinium trenchii TaxID=1381693 RepID=A0ABP0R557_9DINO
MGQVGSQICGFLQGHGSGSRPTSSVELSSQQQRYVPPYALPPNSQTAPSPVAQACSPTGQPIAQAFPPTGQVVAQACPPTGQAVAQAFPAPGQTVAQALPPTGQACFVPAVATNSADCASVVKDNPVVASVAYGTPMSATNMLPGQAAIPCGLPIASGMLSPPTGVTGAAPTLGQPVVNQVSSHPAVRAPGEATQSIAQLPGKRKSLLVGINYFGTDAELHGCIADVKRIIPLLEQQGFPSNEEHQLVLLDDHHWPTLRRPTLANMRQAIRWLTHDAKTGDALFFHYSGHGGREQSSHAASGFVETLCPEDYDRAGMLLDTELFQTLVRPLPSGCRLTCLMDCCHSGGVLNLPYLFTGTQENLQQALKGKAISLAMSKDWVRDIHAMQHGNPAAFLQDVSSMGLGLWGLWKQHRSASEAASQGGGTGFATNVGLAVGEVVAITGCRSDQTSADVGNVQERREVGQRKTGGHRQHPSPYVFLIGFD